MATRKQMEKEQWEENKERKSREVKEEVSTRFSTGCHQRPWSHIRVD